jgi:beta-carotene hydroxylase
METNKTLEREAAKISKEHSGMIAFPTIGLALLVFCLYIFVLFMFASGYLSPLTSTLLLGVLTFASYTPMHEAVHGNVGGSNPKYKWLESAVGLLMSPLISIPFNSHKKEHLAHHAHTNSDEDPDVHIQYMFRSFKDFYRATLRVIKTHNTFVVNNLTRTEIAVSIGWRLLFVLGTGIISIPVLLFGWFSGAFLTIYLLSYLPHKPYKDTARWKNTNIQLFSIRWFEELMFQQNLHAVHHLFPRVPFYNYRTVFEKLEPSMRKKETPIIGMFNRRSI